MKRTVILLICLFLIACQTTSQATPSAGITETVEIAETLMVTPTRSTDVVEITETVEPTETVPPSPTPTIVPSATPYIFENLPLGEWVKLRGMPTARSEAHATVLDGKIYVAGGFLNGGAYWRSSNAFEMFDPMENSWASLAHIPRKLNHLQITTHAGKIYIFGGLPDLDCSCQPDGSSWMYDPHFTYAGCACGWNGCFFD